MRQIPVRYPNHVWSVDRTTVYRWGVWPTYVLVVVDHFSRKLIAVRALPGRAAVWILPVLAQAFARHGAPKYLISDREAVFTGKPLRELLARRGVVQRFGAVGQQGSIAVTERLILTLKQEWLRRLPVIRGHSHLGALLRDFVVYYNEWRGHSALDGAVPGSVYIGRTWRKPDRSAKQVPRQVERHTFSGTRITAFRLAKAA